MRKPAAPLRAAVLRGDLRMFYLLWLRQVGLEEFMRDDAPDSAVCCAALYPLKLFVAVRLRNGVVGV
jgi:hypothetical protein